MIKELSGGFELFAGPERLISMYKNGTLGDYAWYVRASSPKNVLKNPKKEEKTVLSDDGIRSVLKINSLTFNIDKPGCAWGDSINDTKAYLPSLGIGFTCHKISDVIRDGDITEELMSFLSSYPKKIRDTRLIRCKPMYSTYGCYGHLRLDLSLSKHRRKLKEEIRRRGPYIIQPELKQKLVLNRKDNKIYTYIDRIFFSWIDSNPCFAGGFRSFIPVDTEEAKNGRNHGNGNTVWMPIV